METRGEGAVGGSSYAGEPTRFLAVPGGPLPVGDLEAARAAVAALGVAFDARGLVPVVVQQEGSGEVLMVAWADAEALARTLATRTGWFWSRSRGELWNKGATSGNVQRVRRVLVDCDADTLVYVVDSPGPACHTGHRSCFYREVPLAGQVGV